MKIVLVGIGIIVGLASCGEGGTSAGTTDGGIKIAYYVQDSISTQMEYFEASQKEITALEQEYSAKINKFQGEYQRLGGEYQTKMSQGLLSANGEAYYKKKLRDLELEMTSLQQTEGAELETKAMDFQISLLEKLAVYGEEYANENNINLFLAKEKIGVVLYADSTMDVTMDFIKFINKQEKGGGDKAKDSE